jgi:hypothetical protein
MEKRMKRNLIAHFALFGLAAAAVMLAAPTEQAKTLSAERFKSGKVRFVPEITITDEALGGKDYFGAVGDLAVDDKGFLYVCDSKSSNIKKFDAAGKFLKTIAKPGQGPGDLNYPLDIEFSQERLYIRELMNRRVSMLDPEGKFLSSVSISSEEGIWWKMRALPDGRFVALKEIVDHNNPNSPQEVRLDLYSADFAYLKTLFRISVMRNKYVTEPRRANVPVPFAPMVYWDVTSDGKIVIGFSEKYEIEIHDPDKGRISSFSHAYKPVEVTAKDREAHFANMHFAVSSGSSIVSESRGAPDYVVKNTEFPKYKMPFHNLIVDDRGSIWIQPYLADPEERAFDVFDREGAFGGRVKIEGDGLFPYYAAFFPGGFWASTMDKDGGIKVVKYRIAG